MSSGTVARPRELKFGSIWVSDELGMSAQNEGDPDLASVRWNRARAHRDP
jgi:hypothetical protein